MFHQPGGMSPLEQQEALNSVGRSILEQHPEGWSRIEFTYKKVGGAATGGIVVFREDGTAEPFGSPKEAFSHSRNLRHGMYTEGQGTWFSLKYTITPPGKYSVDFNYDERPDFTFPPTPQDHAEEMKKYPRHPDRIPEWLQKEIKKAARGE